VPFISNSIDMKAIKKLLARSEEPSQKSGLGDEKGEGDIGCSNATLANDGDYGARTNFNTVPRFETECSIESYSEDPGFLKELKEARKLTKKSKQVKNFIDEILLDKPIVIRPPIDTESQTKLEKPGGPWTDRDIPSPVPSRKLHLNIVPRVHIISVGSPDSDDMRRLKIYQHESIANPFDLPLISKELAMNPKVCLEVVDPLLRNPQAGIKVVDKVLPIKNVTLSLPKAQGSLQPVFGSWISPVFTGELGLEATSDLIYVVSFCPEHGTLAKALKPLRTASTREMVQNHLEKHLGSAIEKLLEQHPNSGVCFAVVTPLGRLGIDYYS